MAERSCVSLPTVRHYIQTLSILVYSGPTHTIIIAAHGSVRRSTSPSNRHSTNESEKIQHISIPCSKPAIHKSSEAF